MIRAPKPRRTAHYDRVRQALRSARHDGRLEHTTTTTRIHLTLVEQLTHSDLTVSNGRLLMPDGDVFTRSVTRRWRRAASAIGGGLPADECALQIVDCLAKDLRKSGGFARRGLEDLLIHGTADEAQVAARLRELVRDEVFERVLPLLVAKGTFASRNQAEEFMKTCVESARMDLLARSLVSHPNGKGLRRPSRRKSSTSDLLNEPAHLGSRA